MGEDLQQGPEVRRDPYKLTDKDRELFFEAGQQVFERMRDDYNSNPFDAVLFPDSAGRPLMHLVKPWIDDFAKTNGLPKPELHFMRINYGFFIKPQHQSIILSVPEAKDFNNYVANPEKYLSMIKHEDIREQMVEARAINEERAQEILKGVKNRNGSSVNIVAVDDFVSQAASTQRELAIALHQPIFTYSLLSNFPQSYFDDLHIPVFVGKYVPDDDYGFDYRSSDKEEYYGRARRIGVMNLQEGKPKKYSHPVNYFNYDELRDNSQEKISFRNQIREIGEEILSRNR